MDGCKLAGFIVPVATRHVHAVRPTATLVILPQGQSLPTEVSLEALSSEHLFLNTVLILAPAHHLIWIQTTSGDL